MRQSLAETIRREIIRQYDELHDALGVPRENLQESDLCDYDELARVIRKWLRQRSRARASHGKRGRNVRRIAASRLSEE